ncbi:MAG: TonB-dependent receptor [Candidatus Pedobacter colombiensis]|uniref:TonB-dependent receptor n=1 Tax=Candidatus Pedobacter colombiensis TaxID=3121371 RepID=A0AAJ5W548_9SPHI|nr:TonB-dependent receptor [Pedobacter sp.]WEK17750.1 MAG: TonB-dependent receptor [Pedobacter sp.]
MSKLYLRGLTGLFLCFIFYGQNAFSQQTNPVAKTSQKTITGVVKDDKGETIPGVTIKVKGTTKGTTTDGDGKYKIGVSASDEVLIFNAISFDTQEIAIGSNKVINVTLKTKLNDLSEVVVIGYGQVNRRDLTGSVGTVNISDLNKAPVKSFDDALAGRIAGVQVTSPDGQPGASPEIIIRGGNSVTQDNSPLYVVDGFPIENYTNNAINPADIESIEVLKDASSTAIYGARGANGVIIITTKKGKTGPPVLTYNGYYGLQTNTSRVKVMDPYNFVKYQLEIDNAKATGLYLTNGQTLDSYLDQPGLDWQQQVFRTAPMSNHNISLRGGTKDTKYTVSGSIFQQKGTIIGSDFKRYQGRMSLDQQITKKLKGGIMANYSSIISNGTQVGGNSQTAFNYLINVWQYRPVNGTGNLDALLEDAQDEDVITASNSNYQWNPILTAYNEIRGKIGNVLTTNAYLEYSILPKLKLKVTGGYNNNFTEADVFNTSNSRLGSPGSSLGSGGPNGSVTYTSLSNYVNENTLTYSNVIHKDHAINVLAGFTMQGNSSKLFGSRATLVPNESLGVDGLGQGTPFNIKTTKSKNTLASFLGRVNYNYKSKYLATASFRADGSSKFVGDNIWGFFPSGSLAWHMSEENFLKNNKIISDVKIRTSYGVTGNNRVDDRAAYALLTQGGADSYSFNSTFLSGAYASSLANPALKWESTAETDIGLDLGFFNQRITLTTDVYNKKTTDLLLNAQLPGTSGYASAYENIGAVQNRGLEFTLGTTNITGKNFNWSSSFNIAFNRNKVLALAQGQQTLLTTVRWYATGLGLTPDFAAQVGQPVAMFYGYKWAGVYQYSDFDENTPGVFTLKANVPNNGNPRANIKPGDIKYVDLTGDNIVDGNDLTVIGNPNPKFTGGFSNNFSYKGFDLNVFFQFVYGNQIQNINKYLMEGSTVFGSNQYATYQDRWTPTNPSNTYFRTGGGGPAVYSSRLLEDGSYLRLKTVNLGYTFDPKILRNIKLSKVRCFVSAQNLLTWTKYSGLDPEVSSYSSALTPGMDYSAYPKAKVITFGLDVSL